MNNTKKAFENCATGGKREQLAERFTLYLKSRNTKENAYVVNLNGAWGTGKTYFVTEWKKLVEEQDHIAIKIDAWESDYLNDPLAIIIAELLEQIKASEDISDDNQRFNAIQEQVSSTVIKCSKNIFPILSNMLSKHLLGEEATTLLKSIFNSVANQETVKNDLNMGKLGLDVVEQHQRHKTFKKDFITQVKELIKFVSEDKEKQQKVFIFIDELDRCRPTYAIEMLETVKHLFDIPNFIFVLSTDTNQLQHSIKAVYGNEFDSHEYLSRFFEQRLTLPEPDFFEFLTAEGIFDKDDFKELPTLPAIDTEEQLRAAVALICEQNKHHLSLRRAKQICAQLEVVIDSKELKENAYPILTLIGLVFGNALYGGWSKPTTQLERARLALADLNRPNKEIPIKFNKFEIYKYFTDRTPVDNAVNCDTLISATLSIMKRLINSSQSGSIFGDHHIGQQFKRKYFELMSIKQSELLTKLSELHKLYSPNNIIADEPQLFKIIENLNILSDTPEE